LGYGITNLVRMIYAYLAGERKFTTRIYTYFKAFRNILYKKTAVLFKYKHNKLL